MASCVNCNSAFKSKTGGYYRYSLEKVVPKSGLPARDHLCEITGSFITPVKGHDKFLCPSCWNKLTETVRFKSSRDSFFGSTTSTSYVGRKRTSQLTSSPPKRPRYTSTPLKKTSTTARGLFGQSSSKHTKWDTIISYIKARQYSRAIFGLYNATNGSKRSFGNVVKKIVRNEVKQLLDSSNKFPLCQDVNLQSVSAFSWEETLDLASSLAPILLQTLKGAVTNRQNEQSLIRGSTVNLKPRVGTSLALLLSAKSPKKCSFLPTLLSVQFWRGHLKRDTIKQISRLGLCVGYEGTLSAIDKIRADFDKAAIKLKQDLETTVNSQQIRSSPQRNEDELELSNALSVTVPNIEDEVASVVDETWLYSDVEGSMLYPYSDYSMQDDKKDENVDDDDDDMQVEEDILGTDDEDDDDVGEDEAESGDDISGEASGTEAVAGCSIIEGDSEIMDIVDIEVEESAVETEAHDSGKDNEVPGFSMCWDNVGKKVIARHPTETLKNRYMNMALGYIAIHRVSSLHLDWKEEQTLLKAQDIPLERFLPSPDDINHLNYRLNVIVGRILARHIPWFKANFSQCTTAHIVHDYSLQSTWKSVLINLGVFDEDPCSTQGAINIYERLQKYVPIIDGQPLKTLVYGDGLSCERGNDAQRARVNGLSPIERLEGVEPAVQEFHKEMLLLQDFYDTFFNSASAANKGTLSQIKNILNYRQVKSDIGDNFSHAWELMCTTVEAFTCLLCMTMFNMDKVGDRPDAPENVENGTQSEKDAFFSTVCKKVVETIWQALDVERLKEDTGDNVPVVCCGDDIEDEFIGCECRSSCTNGEFFHYSCVGIDPDNVPIPWYCSLECKARTVKPYSYCVCQQDLGGNVPMLGCSAETSCTRHEWYHMACIGVDPNKPPKGRWYCCEACRPRRERKGKKQAKTTLSSPPKEDLVRKYSVSLIWAGLNLLCRRDAVREADGEAMMSFWRQDLVHFYSNKHPKYLILAHRLIASINGWMPDKIRHDLIHNRTVNYSGGIGRNLPLDFMNEILNRLFKDLLDCSKGRYTDATIQRCSQIVGPLGEALDVVFDTKVVENEVYRHRRRAQNRDGNVECLINLLQKDCLFKNAPGRVHTGLQHFDYNVNPRQAERFAAKIKQLSKRLDKRRRVVINV